MSKYVLTPCRILQDRLVNVKGAEPVIIESMQEMIKRFAPTRYHQDLRNLTTLRRGGYMGFVKGSRTGNPTFFVLMNKNLTNDIGWLLKAQPNLESRLIELYRVDEVLTEAKVIEAGSQLAQTG